MRFTKRVLIFSLLYCLIFNLNAETATAKSFGGGAGTLASPYKISNLSELRLLSENKQFWIKHFILTNDIDATDTNNWNNGDHDDDTDTPPQVMGFTPIGNANYSEAFTGSFNGNGYSISNLYINRPGYDKIGLFGQMKSAELKSLILVNVNITGKDDVGGLIGYAGNDSATKNCTASGTINGAEATGGIVGSISSSVIKNSSSSANINKTNTSGSFTYLGGIAGQISSSTLQNCFSSGTIKLSGSSSFCYAGGLCGEASASSIVKNCHTGCDISGSSSGSFAYSATLICKVNNSQLVNCYAAGSNFATINSANKGSLCYEAPDSTISNCYSTYTGSLFITKYQNPTYSIIGNSTPVSLSTLQSKDFTTEWRIKSEPTEEFPWIDRGNSYTPTLYFQHYPSVVEPDEKLIIANVTYDYQVRIDNSSQLSDSLTYSLAPNSPVGCTIDPTTGLFSWKPRTDQSVHTYLITVNVSSGSFQTTMSFVLIVDKMRFAGGDGSAENPFQVETADQLINLSIYTAYWKSCLVQTKAIDMSGKTFSPIGDSRTDGHRQRVEFLGYYNGNGYKVSNLSIDRPTEPYVGLFGYTKNSIIENVILENSTTIGSTAVGNLIGASINSETNNCFVKGNVKGLTRIGGAIGLCATEYVGFPGYSYNHDLTSDGTVEGSYSIGGLIGLLNGSGTDEQLKVTHSFSSADVSYSSEYENVAHWNALYSESIGGLIGEVHNSNYSYININHCYASGNVTGGEYYSGGLIGYQHKETENDYYNHYITTQNCYATGSVSGHYYVGGLVGNSYKSEIKNCYATGSVTADNYYAGGLLGYNYDNSEVKNCYAIGTVSGAAYYQGGLVGFNDTLATVTDGFWDKTTTTQDFSYGSLSVNGLTTAEIQTKDFSTLWSFSSSADDNSPWIDKGTDNYPTLYWQKDYSPLVLLPIGNKSVNEGSNLSFTVSSYYSDDTTGVKSYSVSGNVPVGVSLTSSTGLFSWTPTEAQGGSSYDLTISVTDGKYTDNENITIFVNKVNNAPILQLDQQVYTTQYFDFSYSVKATDDSSEALSYSLSGSSPSGLSISRGDGIISWTPSLNQTGEFPITVNVSDGENSTTDQLKLIVIKADIDDLTGGDAASVSAFNQMLLANSVTNIEDLELTSYQQEFARNSVLLNDSVNHYQEVINAVNEGDSIVMGSLSSGWNLISNPFSGSTVRKMINDGVERAVFSWDSNSGLYRSQSTNSEVQIGFGYWVYLSPESDKRSAGKLTFLMRGTFNESASTEVTLGWNLVAPIAEGTSWSSEYQMFDWEPSLQKYDNHTNEEMSLGKGYWLFNTLTPPH